MSRKNISLTAPIEERASWIMKKRGFTGLSDMIAVLVREEYERRVASGEIHETPTEYRVSSAPAVAAAGAIVQAGAAAAQAAPAAQQSADTPVKYTIPRSSKNVKPPEPDP